MTTLDGCRITTIEQTGEYTGKDLGRIWIHNKQHRWTWYGGFTTEKRRREVLRQAQAMTFAAFDDWFDTAP